MGFVNGPDVRARHHGHTQERKYQRTMGRCLAKMSIAVGPGLSVCCIALRINHDERISVSRRPSWGPLARK